MSTAKRTGGRSGWPRARDARGRLRRRRRRLQPAPRADEDHRLDLDGRHLRLARRASAPGPVSLVVTNLTRRSQQVMLASARRALALRQLTAPINPRDTATLEADMDLGRYTIGVAADRISAREPARRRAPRRPEGAVAAVAPRARPCDDRHMAARWLGALAGVAAVLPAAAAAQSPPQTTPQALFESTILADAADDPARRCAAAHRRRVRLSPAHLRRPHRRPPRRRRGRGRQRRRGGHRRGLRPVVRRDEERPPARGLPQPVGVPRARCGPPAACSR